MTEYAVNIGLEVHAQLSTRSKLFCGCPVNFGAAPNSRTCPVCLGLPGALPVVNGTAVEYAIRIGLAAGCRVNKRSVFARKNYFYPDCPKNYQITQYDRPILTGGRIRADDREIELIRIHLEEDAGKLIHPDGADHSLVDMNRCGVPLIEIVTRPDISSGREAAALLKSIRRLVRYLGISDGNMEQGSLRCDVNVSVRPPDQPEFGTKTEVKNLNSFKSVEQAIDYEIERQRDVLKQGGRIEPETMLWDPDTGEARVMRSKEEARDYRYFQEPDLPVLVVSQEIIDLVKASLPELPAERQQRFVDQFGLSPEDAGVLAAGRELADYYEELAGKLGDPETAAKWITGEVLRELNERSVDIAGFRVSPDDLAELIKAKRGGRINRPTARRVLKEMADTGADPDSVIAGRGLVQISDDGRLRPLAQQVLDENPAEVQSYLGGKQQLMTFFIGQMMKASGGKADPLMCRRLLAELLEQKRS